MKKPEILSPAGSMASLKAAILAGCDAVYLGGYIFGARAFSTNFSNEEMEKAVRYAHAYNVKIYVTVNTLIYEKEVDRFLEYIDFLYHINVDAIIVQDIGMMDLVRQLYPDFDIHASTQMHIHNIEGVKLVEKLGLQRTVLARETSIDAIKEIKANTNIELEIFVHGALCISYSGQCLMSSLIGGRSGNRGTCAGSCRQKYDVLDDNKKKVNIEEYNLSTKDLNSLENIGKLIDANVDSLKIEGRMKSPSYVFLVTKLYREAVDSYVEKGKEIIDYDNLSKLVRTFNRMFTKGFLFNADNSDILNPIRPNHMGIEIGSVLKVKGQKVTIKLSDSLNINDGIRFVGKEDAGLIVTKIEKNGLKLKSAKKNDIIDIYCDKNVLEGNKVLKTTDYLLNKEITDLLEKNIRKVKIRGLFKAHKNEKIFLSINDGNNIITLSSEYLIEGSINKPTSINDVKKQLNKTGSTIFEFEELNIDIDDNIFIPVKEINELRRTILEQLLEKRIINDRTYNRCSYKREVKNYDSERIKSIYIQTVIQYDKVKDLSCDRIYMNEDVFNKIGNDDRKILKLPRVISNFSKYSNHLLVGELGSINYYNDIDSDFSLNIVNSYSVALLNYLGVKRVTLSYELNDNQINQIITSYKSRYNANPNLAIIAYAKEEIMVSKFNLLKYYNLFDKGYLKDRFNNLYKISIQDNLMYIYNYKARKMDNIEKYFNMGINEIRYNIIDEEDLNKI